MCYCSIKIKKCFVSLRVSLSFFGFEWKILGLIKETDYICCKINSNNKSNIKWPPSNHILQLLHNFILNYLMYKLNIKTLLQTKEFFLELSYQKWYQKFPLEKLIRNVSCCLPPLIIIRGESHSKQLTFCGGVKIFQLYCAKL